MDLWEQIGAYWFYYKRAMERGAALVDLHPVQQEAVDKLENGRILCGPTGAGKSITAMAYYYSKVCAGVYADMGSMRRPHDVYVITTAKKRDSKDWQEEAAKFVVNEDRELSVSNVQLTVDSWNNISKYEGVEDAFFIFDEQRLVGSGSWVQSFYKIAKRNKWIMLSATPGDNWLDYIPVFVANGFYKNRTAFKREHVVYNTFSKFPKVDRYIGVNKLVQIKNELLVKMPVPRHTIPHTEVIEVDHDVDLMQKVVKKRWHVFENRPLRDVAELFRVMRKVVNSDSSRLRVIEELLRKHPKLIVFYNFDYELEMLRTLGSTGLSTSGNGLRNGKSSRSTRSSRSFEDRALSGAERKSESSTTSSGISTEEISDAGVTKCGERAPYMKHHTGLCVLEKHGPETEHLIEMVTGDTSATKYNKSGRSSGEDDTKTLALKNTSLDGSESTKGSGTHESADSSDAVTQGVSLSVAEWNGHKHQPIPDSDRWVYLVQYVAGSEGWNCIETDAMVFYSLTYSYKNFHQGYGRIDRLNTPFTHLYYYVLKSNSWIDKMIWKSLSEKRNFNESSMSVSL